MALSYSNGSAILQRVLLKKANRVAQATDTRSLLSTLREPYLIQFTVFLVAYGIAGKLGQATTNIRSSNLGPVWPAYGIALAAFLVCGYRIWPAVAVGSFLIAFFSPVTHVAALGQSAGATVAAFSGAFLLQRVAKFDKSLSRLRDALALVVLGALGSALVSASIGTSVLYATQVHAYSGLGSAWLIYWLGDATGVLLITPLVLTLPNFLRSQHRARITELAVLFIVLTAACFLIFGDPGLIPVRLHVLAFAVLPFVMWAAIRFGVMGAGLSVLLIATIATVETALGSGPFAISTPFTNAVLLGAFFAVLSVTGITLASVIAEREQAQREREQGVREQGALEARLEAEQAVRASEERLRLAQQAARIGTFERNMRTGVVTWTAELEAMYGLPPGGFEGTTIAFFESLIHHDDRARIMESVDCALKTGKPTTGEWRVLWPDGSTHWIAGRWKVFMNESGEPSRMIGVNMDITERKRTEEALLEVNRNLEGQAALLQSREELLKIFVKSVPAGVAMLDRDMRYLQVSDRWCADYSVDSSEILGRSHYELFPDIPQGWKDMHRRALEGETLRADEDPWKREGGTTQWIRWEIRPWRTPSGVVGGILIFAEDITRRKQMEEAISGVSGRLIEAQERERGRIARDLHDDICQQLALVSIGLDQVQRKLPDSVSEHRSHVGELRKRIIDISTDVQMMSHELHSAKLSYLSTAVAMKGFCREFGEHHKFEIEFERCDLPRQLPPDVSLCLFRVLQEALHNAAKHSGVKRFAVQLWGTSRDVHLTISDLGSGFDTESAMKGRGLGITSMQERLKLVKGELTITSQPKRGTTIHARVPLDLESQSALATG
jgi:PAS domain S-box-containing protein